MIKVPPQLILEREIMNKEIKKVLFYHNTDRWYFGDLLRHSAWIESLCKISKDITIATSKNYLTIFENHPAVKNLIPIDKITEKDFSNYDLIIIPSSLPPTYYSPLIKRGIYSYNKKFEYTRYGVKVQKFKKEDLNYFDLARPKFGQTYLPDGGCLKLYLTKKEKTRSEEIIQKIFPGNEKIIILNPTSSNIFTRETNIKKEVGNLLSIDDYKNILLNMLKEFPQYSVLIAASIKPNDQINFELLDKLGKSNLSNRIKTITTTTTLEKGITLREFGVILANKRIHAMLGNGTGTNTHFAATFDLPAMSIERLADEEIINNWKNPNLFQMGPFRWRNPGLLNATYTLDWSKRNEQDFEKIVRAFKLHLATLTNWQDLFIKNDLCEIISSAKKVLTLLKDGKVIRITPHLSTIKNGFKNTATKEFYFDFASEITYLSIVNNKSRDVFESIVSGKDVKNEKAFTSNKKIIFELLQNSNIVKLLTHIAGYDIPDQQTEDNTRSESVAIYILKKIRAGIRLSKEDLKKISFQSEFRFQKWINQMIKKEIMSLIKSCQQKEKYQVKGSWQNRIYSYPKLNLILKIIDINKRSHYFRKKDTVNNLSLALLGAGSIIPNQSELIKYNKDYIHFANKVIPFMSPFGFEHGIVSKRIFPAKNINQNVLALGWVTEFIDSFVELANRGIYNMDCRFADVGIDKFGIFYLLDPGYCKDHKSIRSSAISIKNPLYLGINVLARNRVLLNKFKNRTDLIRHYDNEIQKKLGIDFSSFSLKWKFGDHTNPELRPVAQKFKRSLLTLRRNQGKPVYPLINDHFQDIIAGLIRDRC